MDCLQQRQGISYCGVNAHFQNGRAKKKIHDLQDAARTCLLSANRKWPEAITINLWPYAIRYAGDVHNHVPRKEQKRSPIQIFSDSDQTDRYNIRCFHVFGCHVYVLNTKLQAGQKGKKWD